MSLPETPLAGRYLLCLILLASLCHGFSPIAFAAITLQQPDGTPLVIEQPADRIITLSPHLAELAFSAGAGERVIATVEYSDYPKAVAALPRIGDAFRFDLERILALKPDLVIAWGSGNPATALMRLEDLGLKVWRIEILDPDDIPRVLGDIARSAGLDEPRAVEETRKQLARLRQSYSGNPEWSYFYQVSQQPLFTLNGSHLVSRGLAICGGRNVFAQEPVIAPQVSREAVLQADPDVLIAPVLPNQANPLDHWRDWPGMEAIRQHRMLLLPADEISRATPRTLNALALACKQIDTFEKQDDEDNHP